jgi:hypothetical protein
LPSAIASPSDSTVLNLAPAGFTPLSWPETTFRAPSVDGPKSVSKELSLIAKFWA